MASLELEIVVPLRDFDLAAALAVASGETLALVGPSGAGKTTVLRAIAGLLHPAAGRIALGDDVLFDAARRVDLPPERRRVGYVFQEYALFPHMTVEQNVAFGGKRRVGELLRRLRIEHLAAARPGTLSGGERQRVGLARALATEPRILLLDEPMSALDAHTRNEVRAELQGILRELDLPALLVTHDFEDAAALADRVGVIVAGRVRQVGAPAALLAEPADAFVASFVGSNLLPGTARRADASGLTTVDLDSGETVFSADSLDGRVGVVVHPWDVSIALRPVEDSVLNHVSGPVVSIVPVGSRTRVRVGPVVAELTTASAERLALARGTPVVASFKATATRLVPLQDTGPADLDA
ncbi:MAG: ABC transporter ATP-binding protein [Thermoleophilia bacterium]